MPVALRGATTRTSSGRRRLHDDLHIHTVLMEVCLRNKTKTRASYISEPVWCHRCYIRIAPYDIRTVFRGKDYHRECFTKLSHAGAKRTK
jgi:hypothetical protein